MSTRKLSDEDLLRIENLAKGWGKIVVKHQWGEGGPGLDVDLTQMEDVAMAALRGLASGTLESATQQQANLLDEQQPCPDCGRMCPIHHDGGRDVTIRNGGVFHHDEPQAHCSACRRDFFPSASLAQAQHARL